MEVAAVPVFIIKNNLRTLNALQNCRMGGVSGHCPASFVVIVTRAKCLKICGVAARTTESGDFGVPN